MYGLLIHNGSACLQWRDWEGRKTLGVITKPIIRFRSSQGPVIENIEIEHPRLHWDASKSARVREWTTDHSWNVTKGQKSTTSTQVPEREKAEPIDPSTALRDDESHEKHNNYDDSSDTSSVFSESRHTEGPRSIDHSSTGLSRTTTRILERVQTTASTVTSTLRSRAARPAFTRPLTSQKTYADVLVDFDGKEDPYRPINWPYKKKATTTVLYGFTAKGAAFASSVYSAAVSEIAADVHQLTSIDLGHLLVSGQLWVRSARLGTFVWIVWVKAGCIDSVIHLCHVYIWRRSCEGRADIDDLSLLAGYLWQCACDEHGRCPLVC